MKQVLSAKALVFEEWDGIMERPLAAVVLMRNMAAATKLMFETPSITASGLMVAELVRLKDSSIVEVVAN